MIGDPCKWRALGLATFFISVATFAAPKPETIATCETCHGKGGNSETALTPSIAGQPETFLTNQLFFFREELRVAKPPAQEGLPSMRDVARRLNDKQMTELAKYFSTRPVRITSPGAADPKVEARARQLTDTMHCGQCHLQDFRGRSQMPRIAGQREDYLVSTMLAYRDGKRTGADTTMTEVLYGVSDADIKALGHFLARRK